MFLWDEVPELCRASGTYRNGIYISVVLAFAVMSMMMGENMKKKMAEYQNALEEMSSEAVEYVRRVPVVKTFGQSVFSYLICFLFYFC